MFEDSTVMYTPDKWIVLEVVGTYEPLHKVFGTWSGGYLSGDSWRLNSGIESCELKNGRLHFHGSSGSIYSCHPEMFGIAGLSNYGAIQRGIDEGQLKIIPEDTDWVNFKYV